MDGYASDSRNPYGRVSQEIANEQRLQREAREHWLGTLGDREAPNVARVEVTYWFEEPGLGMHELTRAEEHAGYFLVHADGEHEGGLYGQFEELVGEAMDKHQRRLGFADWQIDDICAA